MSDGVEEDGLLWTRKIFTKDRVENKFYQSPEAKAKKVETLLRKHNPKPKEVPKRPPSEVAEIFERMAGQAAMKEAKIKSIMTKDAKAFAAKQIGSKKTLDPSEREGLDHRLYKETVRVREVKLKQLRDNDEKKLRAERKETRPLSAAATEALAQRLCPPAAVTEAARERLREKVLTNYRSRPNSARAGTARGGTAPIGDVVLQPDEIDALAARLSTTANIEERKAIAREAADTAVEEGREQLAATLRKSRRSWESMKKRTGAM